MKRVMELEVCETRPVGADFVRLSLRHPDGETLPEMRPGQFVNIAVPGSRDTFLRRPISVHAVDECGTVLRLLIRLVGTGTRALSRCSAGDRLNVLLPLGNSFPVEGLSGRRVLLVGGGIGVAPLLYYAERLKAAGAHPRFLLGFRRADESAVCREYENVAPVHLTTEDGSAGAKGFVTAHPIFDDERYDVIACCGPAPMMKAVAAVARRLGSECYVSLENMMACGLGACLCCVEKTVRGNVCVCTEGPVFNINELTW